MLLWGFFYLTTRDVDGCYDVGSVSIKAPDATRHGRAHQIFVDVKLHQISRTAFQHLRIQEWVLLSQKPMILKTGRRNSSRQQFKKKKGGM